MVVIFLPKCQIIILIITGTSTAIDHDRKLFLHADKFSSKYFKAFLLDKQKTLLFDKKKMYLHKRIS